MKDVQFLSAQEKELILKAWKTFLKNGLKFQHFRKNLYNHLIQHCSFIAHYSQYGFYETYFHNPEDTIRFLSQFDKNQGCISVEYGCTYWLTAPDYEDINQAMCDALEPYKAALYAKLQATTKSNDLSQAQLLLAKHGLKIA